MILLRHEIIEGMSGMHVSRMIMEAYFISVSGKRIVVKKEEGSKKI